MATQAHQPSISPLERAIAGAAAGVLANALVYPLDISKTRLQVQVNAKDDPGQASDSAAVPEKLYVSVWDVISRIYTADGLEGLYAGINGSLIGVASTNFAYFYWYNVARSLYTRSTRNPHAPSMAAELSLGAIAGGIAQVFTIPVSVITTRQQTHDRTERKGLVATAREIIDGKDGICGLWRGLQASLVLVVNPAITYGAYERLKHGLFLEGTSLRPWEAFFLGALSKTLATFVTQPLIVAKVMLQSKPPSLRKGVPFRSFVEVLGFIGRHEGLAGLFKGLGPQILKGLLVQGFLMMAKERIELLFVLLLRCFKLLRAYRLGKLRQYIAKVPFNAVLYQRSL